MKAKVIILAGLVLTGAVGRMAFGPGSVTPPLEFTYSERPLTMAEGTGIYIRIDVTVPAGQTAVIEWTPLPGLDFLPVHEIKAPFPFATDEMWSRFVISNDVLGYYRVVSH